MTTRVCVLGYPVGHSRSPAMHNAAFEALGLDWHYEAVEVEPAHFEKVVRELQRSGFAGANVTVPHKLSALAIADEPTQTARAVGAANTLMLEPDRIRADNTDVAGFLAALRRQSPDAPAGMRALVLGAGGAARAVVFALLGKAASVAVWNRHPERAAELVADLQGLSSGTALSAASEPELSGIELLVNATSVGLGSGKGPADGAEAFKLLRISADRLAEVQVVMDLVYREGGTALLHEAKARGSICVDGIDILVHQGAASFELWTGRQPPLEAMTHGARKRQGHEDG
jgi:shikimate dehydrogenase